MRWILPLLVCAFAPHSLLAEAASGWHVKIARHGTNQSLVSWNFVGAITNAGGVQWKAGVHGMGGFGISSPQTDLTGFYSGPSLSSPRFSDKGGFAHLSSGFEEPFIYVEITPTGVWLKHRSMQIMNSPLTRTTLPSGSVVMDIPFSAFGRGVYSPSTNTFWHNAIEGGFDTTLTVLSYNTDPPVITLIGSPTVTVFRGATFADEGANVTDDLDPPRTIAGSGTVDTSTVGTYVLTYTAQDSYGNEATPVTRTVNVVLNPTGDEDNDGLNNTEEANLGTSPYLRDTDNDGVNDLREVGDQTNPLDPASFKSLSKGLVAYYPFNGNANDESGFGDHGVISGAESGADRYGLANSAYLFDGLSDRSTASGVWLPRGAESRTLSAWVKCDSVPSPPRYFVPIGWGAPSSNQKFGFLSGPQSPWTWGVWLWGNEHDKFSSRPVETRWTLLTATYDGSAIKLYADGRLILEETKAIFTGSGALSIGDGELNQGASFAGSIDDVRIYNRALSSQEIASLYAEEKYAGFGLAGAATKAPFDPATAANWSSGGAEWTVDTSVTHDGVDSVKAQTADGQSTYREYTVTGPAVVDFWWKVSSEQNYDTFSYSLNGVQQQAISGEVDWTYRTLTLPAGTHTIRWTYAKDGSDAVGQDAGWLDDFAVYPATPTLRVRDGSTVLNGAVTVDFGDADLGSAGFTKSLNLANEGYVLQEVELSLPEGSPFTFEGGTATYSTLIGRGENLNVPIYLATQSTGTKTAALTIAAPNSTAVPPQITLTGDVRGPVVGVSLGATTLTSGQTVDMGLAPKTLEFTIRNDGNTGNLTPQVSATGSFQIVQQSSASVAPQGTTTFKVLAQSGVFGPQTGSVVVTSNDGFTPTFTINLTSKVFLGIGSGISEGSVATSGTGGASGWDFASTQLPSGSTGQAIKTGTTPNNGGSVLEMVAQTAGVVSWSWKVSAQENFDWLLCEVDGQEVAGISTKNGVWQTQVVNVPAGANVRWVYRKDVSASAGEDAGYMANIAFSSFTANQSFGQWAQIHGIYDPQQRMPKSGLQAMFGWLGGFGVDGDNTDDHHKAWILSGRLKYRFAMSKTAVGTQRVLFSGDLSSWTSRGMSQRVLSEDGNTMVVEATAPSGTKGFFKVVGGGYIGSAMIEVQGGGFEYPMKYQIEHDQFEVKLWFQSRTIGKTLQECLDQIAALGLKYNEEEVQELINQDRLQSVFAGTAVASFQIGKTEVTWDEWQEVRDWAVANGYSDLAGVGAGSAGNHPVRDISWYDAVKWANAKSEIEGLSPVYFVGGGVYRTGAVQPTINPVAKGYRLPTEIEWEWAAMGGVYTSGFAPYIYSGSSDLELVGWFTGNAGGAVVDLYLGRGTWPVAQKLANQVGLYDMSGNVWEWVEDVVGSARRLRGGGWPNEATECTIISRVGVHSPYYRHPAIGFRVARNAED